MAQYFEVQKQMILESDSTAGLLRDSLLAYFRFLQRDPDSVRFMTWALLEGYESACPMKPEKELFELGIDKIRQAQERGEIRADLEPFFIIKSLLALPMAWFQSLSATRALIDSDIEPAALDELYLVNMVKIFLEGVRPRQQDDLDPALDQIGGDGPSPA
jgi:hypothetical protein